MASDTSTPIDPQSGIPELIRSLTDDSKRLAADEVQLAKLELHQSVRDGATGSTRLVLAAAFGIVAAVAMTILLIAAVSSAMNHNYWAGSLIVGALEVIVGMVALRHGVRAVRSPSYPLQASRESLKDTATWVRHAANR